jgi:CRP-like cAMP-binding protein
MNDQLDPLDRPVSDENGTFLAHCLREGYLNQVLRNIRLFETLHEHELDTLGKICRAEQVAGGTVIFKEGDAGERFYCVITGVVRISKLIPNVGEEALAVLGPGDHFGDMSLFDNSARSAQAIANEDAELISISKAELDKVLLMDRELGYKLLLAFNRTLSKRLREANERMISFLAMTGGF